MARKINGGYLGIDVGTTGVKAMLINEKGSILAIATAEYPLFTPFPQWSEQEPLDWWQASIKVLRQLVQLAKEKNVEIIALGLTGQMHGSVFLDQDQQVIRRAILWNDQRTADECSQITELVGQSRLIQISGNPALTGFQAPKIIWLRNHEPENYKRVKKVLLPKDYIRYKLTGEFATDCSDASGTLLLDLKKRKWSNELLDKLEISINWLPNVFEGSQITGVVQHEVEELIGLPSGIPVVAGGGDNAAAAIGTGIVRDGLISSSIGTSGVLFAHINDLAYDTKGRLHTFCHAVPNKNHLMAVTLSAGNSLRWIKEISQGLLSNVSRTDNRLNYEQLIKPAVDIPPGSEGLIFLPYLTGERTPLLDPFASGAFIGLTSRHTFAHLVRAVMEGVVFSLLDGLQIMQGMGVPINQIRAIGGGGKSELWCQMQADIFGSEVQNLEVEEGPAFGAAILALAANQDSEGVSKISTDCVRIKTKRQPITKNLEIYKEYYVIYSGLYERIKSEMHYLSKLSSI